MVKLTTTMETQPIEERFSHLLSLISSESFLKRQGLNNEVPFFICPFAPSESMEMERIRMQLGKQLASKGVQVLDINLYDMSIEILKSREVFDQIIEQEPEFDKEQLLEMLQSVLDSETHLIPAIGRKMAEAEFDVMFISGVGEVFPYIRSHNVLNNLQSTAKEKPTVLFFPGKYTYSLEDGASLDLFGQLRDDKYYRAFNIYNCDN